MLDNKRHPFNCKDLTGKKINNLTVLGLVYFKNHNSYWLCKCDCGNTTIVNACKLVENGTKSCGCLSHKKLCSHKGVDNVYLLSK